MFVSKFTPSLPSINTNLQREEKTETQTTKVGAAASVILKNTENQPFVQSLKPSAQVSSTPSIHKTETNCDEMNWVSDQEYDFNLSSSDSDGSNDENILIDNNVNFFLEDTAEAVAPVSAEGRIGSHTGGY